MRASANDVLRFRLASQLLAPSSKHTTPADVVHRLFAVQAQDLPQSVWALGIRSPGSTRADIDEMLSSGRVVRSWPMRGTLHFVEAADLRWMLRLTAKRTIASSAKRHRDLGLDRATFDRAAELATDALSGGRAASRDEMTLVLNDGGISTDGQRGTHLIGHLAQTALICWGPPRGKQQALVLLDEWAPETERPDEQESLRRFALRYFFGHGPATLKDLVWWSKLTVAQAKTGLELARADLVEVTHDDTQYWMAPDVADAASSRVTPAVQALPGFDEYVLGYQNRSHSLELEHADRIVPGGNGVFLPTIMSRGRVIGTWRRAFAREGITVSAFPFESFTPGQRSGFEREAARYGRFHGLAATVEFADAKSASG